MKHHTEATKAEAQDCRAHGLSYMGIVRYLADQGIEVSRTTVIRWVKDPQRQVSQPDEPEWKPSFNEQIQAVREILDGNPAEARDDRAQPDHLLANRRT